jgi:aldose 1-epimerase
MAWSLRDRHGRDFDIVLGYDDIAAYHSCRAYLGGALGRSANRIAGAEFQLDGKTWQLAANDGDNHLHGGTVGFNKKIWTTRSHQPSTAQSAEGLSHLHLSLESPDMDEGYPGHVRVDLHISLSDQDELSWTYRAETDRPTLVNLSHHTYFNLAGTEPNATSDGPLSLPSVADHLVQLAADSFLPVGQELIPTGEIQSVAVSPFDLRQPTLLKSALSVPNAQLSLGRGFDHHFILKGNQDSSRRAFDPGAKHATVYHPGTRRKLEIGTSESGFQFYTGNWLDGSIRGKGLRQYGWRSGLCLESQGYPDAVHHKNFPSLVLLPGHVYNHNIIYRLHQDVDL